MANSRERIFASGCRCGSPRPCRQRSRPMRHSSLSLAALALALALCGCSNIDALRTPPPPQRSENAVEDRDTVAAMLMAGTCQSMQHLAQTGPAEQAEIVAAARAAFERSPQGSAKLRYALMLATPGHPARDPVTAQKLLRQLAAQPETLQPIERAVALVELAQINGELGPSSPLICASSTNATARSIGCSVSGCAASCRNSFCAVTGSRAGCPGVASIKA